MAARYAGKVRDWTMWNEPDIDRHKTIEQIVNFNIRTMKIIRRVIPDARIGGLSLANVRVTTDQYLAMLRKKAC